MHYCKRPVAFNEWHVRRVLVRSPQQIRGMNSKAVYRGTLHTNMRGLQCWTSVTCVNNEVRVCSIGSCGQIGAVFIAPLVLTGCARPSLQTSFYHQALLITACQPRVLQGRRHTRHISHSSFCNRRKHG